MDYAIRPYRDGDAEALADLSLIAIRTIGARRYSPQQVEAWSARHPGPALYREHAKGNAAIFVAADPDDRAVAYVLLETDGHLDRLYCHPDHSRRGLSERLLDAAQAHARSLGIARIYTEASELARPAFERAGYLVAHRRDFDIDGVAIHNYAMEKPIA